jgi:predicted dehydrogenase
VKVVVVGSGLIGAERIVALKKIAQATDNQISIAAVVETDAQRLAQVSEKHEIHGVTDIGAALAMQPDWVFVCTPHAVAPKLISLSLRAGANVLVEKPLGRSHAECESILAKKPGDLRLAVGFNYRFYQGIEAIIHDARMGTFGKLISVNMVLAHGNAPGMEKSWKLDPFQCGGGCLIDPGVHLLDIAHRLSESELTVTGAKYWSGFWNTGIEEEAHLLLENSANTIFNVQVSLNRWRSNFRLEVNGTEGYGVVEGRGRSYGPQSYKTGKRWAWQSGGTQAESEVFYLPPYLAEDSFIRETATLFGPEIARKVLGVSPSQTVCNEIEAASVMRLLDEARVTLGLPSSH